MMERAMRLTGAVPVFASESVRLAEAPTVVLAKARPEGATWRCDCAPMPVRFAVSGRVVRVKSRWLRYRYGFLPVME